MSTIEIFEVPCDSCGIGIGENHMEKNPYPIGEGTIVCSQCIRKIERDGYIITDYYVENRVKAIMRGGEKVITKSYMLVRNPIVSLP